MFRDREDAGRQLAQALRGRRFRNPIVLAIPRGGVVTGAVLAAELGADLDVVLSRKLRAPLQRELAIGAIAEDGTVFLNRHAQEVLHVSDSYLAGERAHQLDEIARRRDLFRSVRPAATLSGRSVIVTDDGIATGSTMIAALQTVRGQEPKEVIVAVPVAPPDRLEEIREWCDEAIALLQPSDFWAIGQFYQRFDQVEDDEVATILRQFAASPSDELTAS